MSLTKNYFVPKSVHSTGQPIGLVVAQTRSAAQRIALSGIEIEYEPLIPILISIEDVIAWVFVNSMRRFEEMTWKDCGILIIWARAGKLLLVETTQPSI